MERVLTQEEIDAMVRHARGERVPDINVDTKKRTIETFSFSREGQLTSDQVRVLTSLHEGFARSLAQSMGAYLNVPFECRLVSVEQLTYGEFVERMPDITYMVLFRASALSAVCAMQVDHSIVFPAIDLLLGGAGDCPSMSREVTEMEEAILEGMVKIICHELEMVWSAFGTKFELEGRQPQTQMQRFLPFSEKTLCISLEIKLAAAEGTLNLVFPAGLSGQLLRKLKSFMSSSGIHDVKRGSSRLRERMLDCTFRVTHALPQIEFSVEQLASLAVGEVCSFGIPVQEMGSLLVDGRSAFAVTAVRQGNQRAAQIVERVCRAWDTPSPAR